MAPDFPTFFKDFDSLDFFRLVIGKALGFQWSCVNEWICLDILYLTTYNTLGYTKNKPILYFASPSYS